MNIRESTVSELSDVLNVERLAFGSDKEAELVRGLLDDPSAVPTLSLLAFEDDEAVGHILFTRVRLDGAPEDIGAALLAPLAVLPENQKQGVGRRLIENGLARLKEAGVALVFVLGHPGYYPRCGFTPAGRLGFEAPYPIPEKDAGAWMVQALREGVIGNVKGRVVCADALDKPEYWRE